MIITIDGPAGAGKSSIAHQVAKRLGFEFLDTGALYRAITLGAIRSQIDWDDTDSLVRFTSGADVELVGTKVLLNGDDVSKEIRTPTVTAAIHYVADVPEIRRQLSLQQRRIAASRDIVTEGRDQGSEVFPDAQCKIFLTASPAERARRRQEQLAASGRHLPLEDILAAQNRRDEEDASRPIGALRPADDAVVLQSDAMAPEEVVAKALEIIDVAIRQNAEAAE